MHISSRTPEGTPNRCPVCGAEVRIEPSKPSDDAPCPQCGTLLWFEGTTPLTRAEIQSLRELGSILTRQHFERVRALLLGVQLGLAAFAVAILAYLVGEARLVLGSTEVIVLILILILLFGPALPTLGRRLGTFIVRRNG